MKNIITILLSAIIGYLIGSLNFSLIFSFLTKKEDIRHHGSKNAGMTNTIRVYGKLPGIFVFIGDFLKGIIAIYICNLLFNNVKTYVDYGYLIVGLSTILGHLYPIYFKFKGGKGIATSAGIILTQDVKLFIILVIVFLIIFFIFKIVSISSICAAISYPIFSVIFFKSYLFTIFSLIVAILIIYAHKTNISRLINKTEKKISYKPKTK